MTAEPTAALARHPLRCAVLATRPAFLSITALGVLLGWAGLLHTGAGMHVLTAAVTMLLALAAHAGANLINDFHDTDTDAANTGRIYPFTGGSRFIQNGVMSPAAIGRLGYGLLLAVVAGGLWMVTRTGPGLLLIGAFGMFVGWAYSAPPLRLAARGLGEAAVASAWMLLVVGSDYVQRGSFALLPFVTGLAYGLMVANLLYVNQFPDAEADMSTGKRTLVVRLGRRRAIVGYALIDMLAALVLLTAILLGLISGWALLALPAAFPAFHAYRDLVRSADSRHKQASSIRATIVATHLIGGMLAVVLCLT